MNPWHWFDRAGLHYRQKQWAETVADCTKAIELQPDQAWIWKTRGDAYLELHAWDKASTDFARFIEFQPQKGEGWYLRGVALANMNQLEKAVEDLREAISRGFKNAEQMKSDARLSPLRGRNDFTDVVRRIEGKVR